MRVALINPPWTFEGSIYFGCREPHLPLELKYAEQLLSRAGHETLLLDGHLDRLSISDLVEEIGRFGPEMTILTTAPTYLFWRCAQPELRVPQELAHRIRHMCGLLVAVGPHSSTTPHAALRKLGADTVVMGECEETVLQLANGARDTVPGIAYNAGGQILINGGPRAGRFVDLEPLQWPQRWVDRKHHHHHRFDAKPDGPGAEVEASRGCPFHCSFCAKENFRDRYRRRPLDFLMREIDALLEQGVTYIYFIDEIFLPNKELLQALAERPVKFGIQTRLDLWKTEMITFLGAAGCVSVEAGVESITEAGREALDKDCRTDTEEITRRLLHAKEHVPFVQANLIKRPEDKAADVQAWRERLREQGVWTNDPVPLFPYPGSPDYRKLWGFPDDAAWERAHSYYLRQFEAFSDIQEERPLPLASLEYPARSERLSG